MASVDFDIHEKLILLDLGITSSDGSWIMYLPVVMDTGATRTILSADILVDLGYDPGHPSLSRIRMITGSGVEYAPCVNVSSMIVGGEIINGVSVLCHDLPAEAGIDGLLGLNFLKNFDFSIEYSSGRVMFTRIQA
ncbi:MAG: retroviral-like aspartic protease family protein [Candidatus Marinimicrobia bacterium]|nr:retroviral-like aspartic protease family protein [Candidatus Neomarinimicrobiota bacterium]